MNDVARQIDAPTRVTARALIVGERIDTAGLERPDMIRATASMIAPLTAAVLRAHQR